MAHAASTEEDEDPESNHRFDFRLPMTHSELHGALNRDGDALLFFADLRDCAEFALWCRTRVPSSEQLFLCDEGVNTSLDLRASTTSAEILDALGYEPDALS